MLSTTKMLTIKKVPTLFSNYQEDASDDNQGRGCGRDCLGNFCFPVSQLPLYTFKKDEDEDEAEAEAEAARKSPGKAHLHTGSPISFFLNLLMGQWEDRLNQGLFRYDVTSCETKVLPGAYGFIAQLNEGRHLKKRPTEFRIDQVLQPFDESKFNFTKIGQEEVLFRFEPSNDGKPGFYPSSRVDTDLASPTVVAINVSPIEYGHVLLIPSVLNCSPQRIDCDSLMFALIFSKEASDPFFRVGYNSLGAFATINHIHFQAYYLSVPFPVEKAPLKRIMISYKMYKSGVVVYQLVNYPVRGFVFDTEGSLHDLAETVANFCAQLQNINIPFNILITNSGQRIFLFPQCYAEKQARGLVNEDLLETQVNPGVWEICGHMVLKRKKDYDDASEKYAWKLLAEVSLSEERFQEVKLQILEAAGLKEVIAGEDVSMCEESNLPRPLTTKVSSHMQKDCFVLQ